MALSLPKKMRLPDTSSAESSQRGDLACAFINSTEKHSTVPSWVIDAKRVGEVERAGVCGVAVQAASRPRRRELRFANVENAKHLVENLVHNMGGGRFAFDLVFVRYCFIIL